MGKSGKIGTETETAIVKVLKARGRPNADRLRLGGAGAGEDRGDITTGDQHDSLTIQSKGGHYAEEASDNRIEEWMAELDKQRQVNGHMTGILVWKRFAVGSANAHRWWAAIPAWQLATILGAGDGGIALRADEAPQTCRMPFGELLTLLGIGHGGDD